VEHLFFATKYELVLPWNFDEVKKISGQHYSIRAGRERPDGGVTLIMEVISNGSSSDRGVASIELTLPAVTQSQLERDPSTLGELADLLLARRVDIISALRAEVQSRVDEQGVVAKTDDSTMVILLHLPIVREQGKEPERIVRRAFMLSIGALKFGVTINALIFYAGKYFKDAMGTLDTSPTASWRSQKLSALEVLRFNDAGSARMQSGISEDGSDNVVVGAGSLGSAMLNLWGRSGWGRWTVIDKDHIKPHNLVRHTAYAQHVGILKAEVVAQLHLAVTGGASEVVPICADACDISQDIVQNPLTAAKLVVDVSTTLEYPRLASTVNGVGRHMSAFITPDGNAAVLLVEDEKRTVRLRTLEAQYYRALIQESWGEHHLAGNLGSFWSGASCRDISMVLPYSRVLGHASNLAEQVRLAAGRPIPSICVWSRDPDTGGVAMHGVRVFAEQRFLFDDLALFIDEGVEQKLRALRAKKAPSETGGVLLGYYDFNVKAVVIVDGLPAPADSKSTSAWFERGVEGLATAVADASKRTAGIVRYVGEWHSHPPGHSATPSGNDMVQLAYLAREMAEDGLPAVSLIVGEHDIQVMQGVLRG
jgi:integrative and conjugative element protein (TIGR02256 family)